MVVYKMETLQNLKNLNWFEIFIGFVAIVLAGQFLYKTFIEGIIYKFGWETKKMREKREDHELLIKTSQNLVLLQEKHEKDEHYLEDCLTNFIKETRKENDDLRSEMKKFADNRINDRGVSIEREQRLNGRIDEMVESDKYRDKNIENINSSLLKLTDMFVEKQINDYRWEIINFATAISEKKPCTKDGFKHCFATYEKYEKILEENGLENGEVEISMEIINEAYKERMLEGFDK